MKTGMMWNSAVCFVIMATVAAVTSETCQKIYTPKAFSSLKFKSLRYVGFGPDIGNIASHPAGPPCTSSITLAVPWSERFSIYLVGELNVFIYSNDSDVGGGASSIVVDGTEYSSDSNGISVAIFHRPTGEYIKKCVADVHGGGNSAANSLKDCLESAPNNTIIILAVKYSATDDSNSLAIAHSALSDAGIADPNITKLNSYASITCKRCNGSQPWEKTCTRSNGNCYVAVKVCIPSALHVPYYARLTWRNVASAPEGGAKCVGASPSPATCNQAIDGDQNTDWTASTGVGTWIEIRLSGTYKVNCLRLRQKSGSPTAKKIKIDFSDCSVETGNLDDNPSIYQEVCFGTKIVIWFKILVSEMHNSASGSTGFNDIQLIYKGYDTDLQSGYVSLTNGRQSERRRIKGNVLILNMQGISFIIILDDVLDSQRYKLYIDTGASNKTYLERKLGSTYKEVATHEPGPALFSETGFTAAWIYCEEVFAFGIGEQTLIFYNEDDVFCQMSNVMFQASPNKNLYVHYSTHRDYSCDGTSTCVVLDKSNGPYVFNYGNNRGFDNGVKEVDELDSESGTIRGQISFSESNSKFSLSLDGTSTCVDLGDWSGHCITDPEQCEHGLSGYIHFAPSDLTGTKVWLSGGSLADNDRRITIYTVQNTFSAVLLAKDKKYTIKKEGLQNGENHFSWSFSEEEGLLGVFVINNAATAIKDEHGIQVTSIPADGFTHLTIGCPNNESANFAKGTVYEVRMYRHYQTKEMLENQHSSSDLIATPCYSYQLQAVPEFFFPEFYIPWYVTPITCQISCGAKSYSKAILVEGMYCACVNDLNSLITTDGMHCDVPCAGIRSKSCGGDTSVLVLDSLMTQGNIACSGIESRLPAFVVSSLPMLVTTGEWTFYNKWAETCDARSEKSTSPTDDIKFMFDNPNDGSVVVYGTADFKIQDSGVIKTKQCEKEVQLYTSFTSVNMSCPSTVPTDTRICCTVTIPQGSNMNYTMDWNDNSQQVAVQIPDSELKFVGVDKLEPSDTEANTTSPGVYIVPVSSASGDGVINKFCLHIAHSGLLGIKICKPSCNETGKKFCSKSHSCIGTLDHYEGNAQTCDPPKRLIVETGKCEASGYDIPQMSSGIDYNCEVLHLTGHLSEGRKCWVVLNKTFPVSDGDVVALVIPETDSRASVKTTTRYGSYKYSPTNSSILVGYRSPKIGNSPEALNTAPQIQVGYHAGQTFQVCHKYTTAGYYPSKISVRSSGGGAEAGSFITAQVPVMNLSLGEASCLEQGVPGNLSIAPHPGTNVTYLFALDNQNITTSNSWIMHQCNKSGTLSLTLFARNKVSVSYTVCQFNCVQRINEIGFANSTFKPIANGTEGAIRWYLNNGSHVTFYVDPGDNAGVRNLSNAKVADAYFVAKLVLNYTKEGDYAVNVTACNCLGCMTITGMFPVLTPIMGVSAYYENSVCIPSAPVNLTSSIVAGTRPIFVWKANNEIVCNKTVSWCSFSPAAGTYNITLFVYNDISSAVIVCTALTVHETIYGLSIATPELKGVDKPHSISFRVDNGTSMNISITFGDGDSHRLNQSVHADGNCIFVGVWNHTYHAPGNYTANVTALNECGAASAVTYVIVDEIIAGTGMALSTDDYPTTVGRGCSEPIYVKTGGKVYMLYDMVNGTNVKVEWDYSHGSNTTNITENDFPTSGVRSSHIYTVVGNHTVRVKGSNSNGHNITECLVIVQNPVVIVNASSDSPRGHPPGRITFTVYLPQMPSLPIKCVVGHGDNSSNSAPVLIGDNHILTHLHNYPSTGKFNFTVNCSNEISSVLASGTVELQELIKNLKINITGVGGKSRSELIEPNVNAYDGPGKNGTIFPVEYAVNISAIIDAGSDVTYTFTIICPGNTSHFTKREPYKAHTFTQEVQDCKVIVEARNAPSYQMVEVDIRLEESVVCGDVILPDAQVQGNKHNILFYILKPGTHSLCRIDFGDSTSEDFRPQGNNVNITHQYTFSGIHYRLSEPFKCTVECANNVSRCSTPSVTTRLVAKPCKTPVVQIVGIGPNKTNPLVLYKTSPAIQFFTRNNISCEASNITSSWFILILEGQFDILPRRNGSNFLTQPSNLSYGLYRLTFNINMTEVGLQGSFDGWFVIDAKPLQAKIENGYEVTVGVNKTYYLDGSQSMDPDLGGLKITNDSNLNCIWLCKREDDNYTFPVKLNLSNLPESVQHLGEGVSSNNVSNLGGCYGDGPGRLNTTACTIRLKTEEMEENTTYVVRLYIWHNDGKRQSFAEQILRMIQGDPPSMSIGSDSITTALNAGQEYSLSCKSKQSVTVDWSACEYTSSNCGGACEPVVLDKNEVTTTNTAKTQSFFNLKIYQNQTGKCYRYSCTGSRSQGGVRGEASLFVRVNVPPQEPAEPCDIQPPVAELFSKVRVTCSLWSNNGGGQIRYMFFVAKYPKNPRKRRDGQVACPDERTQVSAWELAPETVKSFPIGDNENGYKGCLCMEAKNPNGAIAISACFEYQVTPPATPPQTAQLEDSILASVASGSYEEVVGLATTIAFYINEEAQEQGQEDQIQGRIRIRTTLVAALTSQTPMTHEAATMACVALSIAIDAPSPEVTSDVLIRAVGFIEIVVNVVSTTSLSADDSANGKATSTIFAVVSVTAKLVAGNNVYVGSAGGDSMAPSPPVAGEGPRLNPKQVRVYRKIAKIITQILKVLSDMVTEALKMGQQKRLQRGEMTMDCQRTLLEKLNNKLIELVLEASFLIPALFTANTEEDSIAAATTVAVIQPNFNIYDQTAATVNSYMLSLVIQDSSNNGEMSFSNTPAPFEISISQKSRRFARESATLKRDQLNLFYFSTNITLEDACLGVEIEMAHCVQLSVYMKRGRKPTPSDLDFNFTMPLEFNSTSCSSSTTNVTSYKVFLSNRQLEDFYNASTIGNYSFAFKWLAGADYLTTLQMNATIFTSTCKYFNTEEEQWSSGGCEVGSDTGTTGPTQCLCNHLTSFASGMFVPPNKIDWDKFLAFDLSQGYVCFSTVLVVIGLYIIFLIPARRADKRDAEKTGVTPIPDNDPRDTYCYEIHVHTGFMRGAGTSAAVSIVLNGVLGDSEPRVLRDPNRTVFKTGGVDAFLLTVPQSLGNLRNIRIWHNNEGNYPAWNLLRVMIQDLQSDQRWWFVCDDWLAVAVGDGKIERTVPPATKNDLVKFNVLFATEVRKNLTDGHLWFSVVTRPANSTFTRVQRLTCCLSILLCTMLANLMFYDPTGGANDQQGPTGSVQIAGFNFSLRQISIGITSSLVVFPANLIVVQLFRKARAKETKLDLKLEKEEFDDIDEEKASMKETRKDEKKTKKEGIPHWCVYIAYFLAFTSSIVAAVIIMAYGFTFGPEKSAQWLLSMSISFFQDVLVSQPLKVFLLASIFALLIKDPNKAESNPLTDVKDLANDEEWIHKQTKDMDEEEKLNMKKLIMDRPPDEAKLEIARQLRLKELKMKSIIREIAWYGVFMLIVLTIGYGNRDPKTQHVTQNVEDMFVRATIKGTMKFNKILSTKDYWTWLTGTVVPTIFISEWYNGREYDLGYLADTPTDWVIAVSRLRQLRVKKNSCKLLPAFHHAIDDCNDFYSSEDEDRRMLLPHWEVPVNSTPVPSPGTKTAWQYQTGEELKTFPYWGYKATYDAGGYVQELPPSTAENTQTALDIIHKLQSGRWLDKYTRAVFTELSIYNANSNFFCVITLLLEQLPTGGIFEFPSILTLKLYRYVGGDMYFVLACEIIYLLFTAYFIFKELKQVVKHGKKHLLNPWSILEILVTMLSLSMVVLYFVRMTFTSQAVGDMRNNPDKFISFHYTAFLDEWIKCIMGLIVFFSFIKIIRLLRFNRRMSLLAQTIKVCAPKIGAFVVLYAIAFFAYAQLACLVFGQQKTAFSTIPRSAATLMDTLLGKFTLKSMTDTNRVLGPIFFYVYTVSMIFILINMFMSIINDSFAEVNSDVNKQTNEYEIVDFMIHRLKENIGKTMGNGLMPIYKEPKSRLEMDFEQIEDDADTIMHRMRNMTFENMRHTRWYDAEVVKDKKKKMFQILLQVDWDYFEDELGDGIPAFENFLQKHDEDQLEDVLIKFRCKKEIENEGFETNEDSDSNSDHSSESGDSNAYDDSDDEGLPSGGEEMQGSSKPSSAKSKASPSRTESPTDELRILQTPQEESAISSEEPRRRSARSYSEIYEGPKVSDQEMNQLLEDVRLQQVPRCVTDAELSSVLPGITNLDDNSHPMYESDSENVVKKRTKKKRDPLESSLLPPTPVSKGSAWDVQDAVTSSQETEGNVHRTPDGASPLEDIGVNNQGFEGPLLLEASPKKIRKERSARSSGRDKEKHGGSYVNLHSISDPPVSHI